MASSNTSSSKFPLIFGIIWIVLSLPFSFAGKHMLDTEARYETEGVSVDGIVTGKHVEEKRERDKNTNSTRISKSYYISFKFNTPDGVTHESKDTTSSDTWEFLNSGDKVQAQYLRSDPSNSRLAHSPDRIGGYLFCAFGALSFIVGAISFLYYFKSRRFVNRLLQHGTLTDGSVTHVGPGSVSINNVRQWQIQYKYRGPHGGEFNGKTKHLPPEAVQDWKIGDKGKVRYDPAKPQKSLWIGEN